MNSGLGLQQPSRGQPSSQVAMMVATALNPAKHFLEMRITTMVAIVVQLWPQVAARRATKVATQVAIVVIRCWGALHVLKVFKFEYHESGRSNTLKLTSSLAYISHVVYPCMGTCICAFIRPNIHVKPICA